MNDGLMALVLGLVIVNLMMSGACFTLLYFLFKKSNSANASMMERVAEMVESTLNYREEKVIKEIDALLLQEQGVEVIDLNEFRELMPILEEELEIGDIEKDWLNDEKIIIDPSAELEVDVESLELEEELGEEPIDDSFNKICVKALSPEGQIDYWESQI